MMSHLSRLCCLQIQLFSSLVLKELNSKNLPAVNDFSHNKLPSFDVSNSFFNLL